MSFNDVAKQRSVRSSASLSVSSSSNSNIRNSLNLSNADPIGEQLQNLQRLTVTLRDKITDAKRRKIGFSEKTELESKFNEIHQLESNIQIKFDSQFKSLDGLPRAEIAQKRLGLGKLQKDYERLKSLIQVLSNELNLVKVYADGSNKGATRNNDNIDHNIVRSNEFMDDSRRELGSQKTIVTLKEVDIDSLIIEERERDIKKINQDILLVNEMFKDMANIVDTQSTLVEEIKTTTDKSHEQAQAGLEQVKQAANNQSSCIIT